MLITIRAERLMHPLSLVVVDLCQYQILFFSLFNEIK